MNLWVALGLLLNTLITMWLFFYSSSLLFWIFAFFLFLSYMGLILHLAFDQKENSVIFYIMGAGAFFPSGFLLAWGSRQLLTQYQNKELLFSNKTDAQTHERMIRMPLFVKQTRSYFNLFFGAFFFINLNYLHHQGFLKQPIEMIPLFVIISILGIILYFMGLWELTTPIIKAYEKHLEIKVGLWQKKLSIPYESLTKLDTQHNKKTFLFFTKNNQEQRLKLPLQQTHEIQAKKFVLWLSKQI